MSGSSDRRGVPGTRDTPWSAVTTTMASSYSPARRRASSASPPGRRCTAAAGGAVARRSPAARVRWSCRGEPGAVVGAAVRVEDPWLVGKHEVREPQGGLVGGLDGLEELGEHVRALLHALELLREVVVDRRLQVELHVLEGVARAAAQQPFAVGRRAVGQQVADDRRHAPGAARGSTGVRLAQVGDRLDHVEVVGRGQQREEVLRVPGEDRRVGGRGLPGQDRRDGRDGEGARRRVARVPRAVLSELGEVREPDGVDLPASSRRAAVGSSSSMSTSNDGASLGAARRRRRPPRALRHELAGGRGEQEGGDGHEGQHGGVVDPLAERPVGDVPDGERQPGDRRHADRHRDGQASDRSQEAEDREAGEAHHHREVEATTDRRGQPLQQETQPPEQDRDPHAHHRAKATM